MRIAVIPARGGSKRIPRKNLLPFAGKPMIAHSIQSAIGSKCFDDILVSTDDAEISELSKSLGANVPFVRPSHLADDYATTTQVISHAVEWLTADRGVPEAVCCIYATAPFIDSVDIAKGIELLVEGRWDFVFSAVPFSYPIHRGFQLDVDRRVEMVFPQYFNTRSQDLPQVWHDAGQFYWGTANAWLSGKPLFSNTSTVVPLPEWKVQDIDTLDDWVHAELRYRLLQERKSMHE
jgi:pseudaminic acid cytidylyltransferase